MGVLARQLYQLGELDNEINANERALDGVNARIGDSGQVLAARASLAAEKERLEALRVRQRSLEWDTDDLRSKLKAANDKLYSGQVTSAKELINLQKDGEAIQARCSRVEDDALAIMDQVSQVEAGIASSSRDLERLEAGWRSEQEKLGAEAERLRSVIAGLCERRASLASGIASEAVAVYTEARKQKGRAVARVEQGTCRGCGIILSTSHLQQARGNTLVRCSSCGRILYLA